MDLAFRDRLVKAATRRDFRENPFIAGLERAEYARADLRFFAQRQYVLTESFVFSLYRLLAICDLPAPKLHLMQNLFEEDGLFVDASGAICQNPGRRHPVLARRFGRACGLAEQDLKWDSSDISVGNWIKRAFDDQRWRELIAYIMVGQEINGPVVFGAIARSLQRHYGFSAEDVEFFTLHVEADEKHGHAGADLVAGLAQGPAEQQRLLAAAERGADAAWAYYRAFDAEIRRRQARNSPPVPA